MERARSRLGRSGLRMAALGASAREPVGQCVLCLGPGSAWGERKSRQFAGCSSEVRRSRRSSASAGHRRAPLRREAGRVRRATRSATAIGPRSPSRRALDRRSAGSSRAAPGPAKARMRTFVSIGAPLTTGPVQAVIDAPAGTVHTYEARAAAPWGKLAPLAGALIVTVGGRPNRCTAPCDWLPPHGSTRL